MRQNKPGVWLALMLAAVAIVALIAGRAPAAEDATLRVEAVGHAYVASPADRDAARRRAIGDALVSAALSGGATLRGYNAESMGRITADLTLLRPTGRILSHELLSADLNNGLWTVRISALVGPMPAGACAGRRRLTVSATPPEIRVRPDAPAWADPLAHQVAQEVVAVLRDHPDTDLDHIAPAAPLRPAGAGMDYTALTRGRSVPQAGDHRLAQQIRVDVLGNRIRLQLDLTLRGPDGALTQRRFERETPVPKGGVAGFLSGQRRSSAEAALSRGLTADVKAMLDGLACQPPQARLVYAGDRLSVPLGRRHGLTRASLAFVDDPNDSFGLLEVVRLDDRQTTLRPLDPTRPASGFAGRRVYFVETGL